MHRAFPVLAAVGLSLTAPVFGAGRPAAREYPEHAHVVIVGRISS